MFYLLAGVSRLDEIPDASTFLSPPEPALTCTPGTRFVLGVAHGGREEREEMVTINRL
jgi:hypothetical protein